MDNQIKNEPLPSKSNLSFSSSIISGSIAVVDSLIIILVGFVVFHFYIPTENQDLKYYTGVIFFLTFITSSLFYNLGIYKFESLTHPATTIRKMSILMLMLFGMTVTVAFVFKLSEDFSRVWTITWFVISFSLMSVSRLWCYFLLQKWGNSGKISRNVAIIGAGEHGSRLIHMMSHRKEPWTHLIGIFDDRATRKDEQLKDQLLLGSIDDLISYVQENRVDDVIIALPWSAEKRMMALIEKLEVLPVHIRLCPDMIGFNLLNHDFSNYCGLPVLNIFEKPISGWNFIAKAIMDKLLSAIILLCIAPLMAIIALAIKLDSPGPVFFRQQRYGFNNQLINVLKFRSMRIDMQDNNAEKLATRNDPRVTKIGAFLRRSSLDELPQFLNVLKGEMSIVGPRPHALQAKAAGKLYQEVAKYAVRHKVTPGITGWAQVNGWRGETDTEDKIMNRVEHDIYYINNWSLFFDLQIIFKTIFVVLNTKNAY